MNVTRMTNAQLGDLAKELGHRKLALVEFGEGTKKGVRYRLECSCGWSSLNFVLVAAAIEAGQRHLRKVVDEHLADERRNGRRVLPGSIAAGL